MLYEQSLRVFFHETLPWVTVIQCKRNGGGGEGGGSVVKKKHHLRVLQSIFFFISTLIISFDFCQRLCSLFNG